MELFGGLCTTLLSWLCLHYSLAAQHTRVYACCSTLAVPPHGCGAEMLIICVLQDRRALGTCWRAHDAYYQRDQCEPLAAPVRMDGALLCCCATGRGKAYGRSARRPCFRCCYCCCCCWHGKEFSCCWRTDGYQCVPKPRHSTARGTSAAGADAASSVNRGCQYACTLLHRGHCSPWINHSTSWCARASKHSWPARDVQRSPRPCRWVSTTNHPPLATTSRHRRLPRLHRSPSH